MKSPRVSIIVPVYNVEKYLSQCLDSILAQSFNDFEILLVDDGSTDRSGAICDEYKRKDSRILVAHKANGGLSSSRNTGIEMAQGKWVVFIDSDDIWGDAEGLSNLVECAENLSLDVLRFEYQAVNEELQPIEPRVYDKSHIENRLLNNYELVKYGVAGEWFAVLYLIRKSVIEDFRFDETIRFQEDIDFYCRLFSQKNLKCGYIDRKIYLYRKRSSSITTSPKIENLRSSFQLGDTFYAQSKNISHPGLRGLYEYDSVMMYYWTLNTITEPPYCRHMEDVIKTLELGQFQKRVMERFKGRMIFNKFAIFIVLPPALGAKLLKFKNHCVRVLKKLENR